MFSRQSNASKVGFVTLVRQLQQWGFELIDCQMQTAHLLSLGARSIARRDFAEDCRPPSTAPASPSGPPVRLARPDLHRLQACREKMP